MDKKIYLVRHAQGEHNISDNFYVPDAILTPHGHTQCQALQATFPHHSTIEIILSSPLRRAIQTAIHSFAPALLRPDVNFLLVPLAQEISAKPCDVGHERDELREEMGRLLSAEGKEIGFDGGRIDYSILDEGWSSKKGLYEDSLQAVEARAAELRMWLWRRPEKEFVLVTHGAFLHYLTEDWDGFHASHGTAYKNCEYRCFTFTEDSDEREAHLTQVGKTGVRATKPLGTHAKDITGVHPN
ncbi:phosphoglycerate mutase family protein-like protein [Mollisia scopiformis]|uniref:Phosphoglycerate mutase family protein-like protein n=1 Tax=Mollisia scopiformis TaxID=149040 RepID=A0A194X1Z2_MOLSC|nr:phosphoglycerate mutase family protein-like protein [Mollisia scopiformis]KUJ13857.1 phosphoglycerate mutase family protein-like protein [Mollisia scopiformis]